MATYKIKYGDTLSQIAANNNTTVDEILKANPNITDRNKIYAGTDLNLPGTQTQQQNVPASAGSPNLNNGSSLMKSNINGVSDEQYTALNTKPVVDSQAYQNASALVEQLSQQLKQPGKYTEQLDQILGSIMNRGDFSYDFETDPMFQKMMTAYESAGQKAQENAIARSAALSGGYANSWSQYAGQQAYNEHVQQGYSQLPAYYQLALDAYNAEGNKLMEQYSLLSAEDQKAYDKLLDQLNFATGERDSIWNKEYTSQSDYLQNLAMLAQMANSEYWRQKEYDYQVEQDRIANAQRAAAAALKTTGSLYNPEDYVDSIRYAYENGTLEQWEKNLPGGQPEEFYAAINQAMILAGIPGSTSNQTFDSLFSKAQSPVTAIANELAFVADEKKAKDLVVNGLKYAYDNGLISYDEYKRKEKYMLSKIADGQIGYHSSAR